jgi:hypothetical protein
MPSSESILQELWRQRTFLSASSGTKDETELKKIRPISCETLHALLRL